MRNSFQNSINKAHKIPSGKILLIDDSDKNLGTMLYNEASIIATEKGLGLMEVGSSTNTPVFKIVDVGKWKYQQKKSKKSTKHPQQKEIKLRVRIDSNDLLVKIKKVKEFLTKKHPVRISVVMKGREQGYPQIAKDIIDKIAQAVIEYKVDDIKIIKSDKKSTASTTIHPAKG